MAAGEATLRALTSDVYAGIERQAARLEAGIAAKPIEGASVSRVGSLITVFFRDLPPRNFREAKSSNTEAFGRFFHTMLAAGVILPPSQFEAWFVSAAHRPAVIDATLEAIS
jgi:glutamate-1-semialdehyde 2,1-aminomutase